MLKIFARLMVSRWLWRSLGVLAALTVVFTLTAVAVLVAGVLLDRAVGREPDVEWLTVIALIVGMLAATAALVGLMVLAVVRRRGRIRQWVPLRESMLHDATTLPATYLVQISSRPQAAVGGAVQAVDLLTSGFGCLWLPASYPTGTVLCFSIYAQGPVVRAWMTGAMWTATAREAARADRNASRERRLARRAEERRLQAAADQAVAEAERILRQSAPR
jgi:ABC-type multidrug transport system fused ATPase/permease subunit